LKKKIILGTVMGFVFLAAVLTFIFIPKTAVVPDVVGQTISQATSLIEEIGLTVEVSEDFSSSVAKDVVISQNPDHKLEKVLEKGSKVNLIVSKGPELIVMPDITNLSFQEASEVLSNVGLIPKKIIKCHNTIEENVVISQEFEASQLIAKGSEVSLIVSAGIANTVGNTAGNLENKGYAAEQGDWLYVSKNNSLIKVNKKTNRVTALCKYETSEIYYVNVVAEWVYYFVYRQGIYKIRLYGTGEQKLLNVPTDRPKFLYVEEGYLYYILMPDSPSWLHKMDLNNGTTQTISTNNISTVHITENDIYFYSSQGPYQMKKDGKDKIKLSIDGYLPMIIKDNVIYFTNEYGYLCKTDMKNFSSQTLLDESVITFNISGDWIYYLSGKIDNFDLYKMKLDGTDKTFLSSNNHAFINVVGDWIVCSLQNSQLLRVKTDGSVEDFAWS